MPLTRRSLLSALPIAGAAVLGAGFWRILTNMQQGRFDPRAIGSPLIGQDIPSFTTLSPLPGLGASFTDRDLRAQTAPVLVNFFASWCIPCVEEMAALRALSHRLPIWGIAYKDRAAAASAFIRRDGSPFTRVAADHEGRVAIDWGVSGVPESFLVVPGGKIIWHSSRMLNEQSFETDIRPRLTGTHR